ncbi:hypothetical protein HYQ46_008783 [Verticillium longisporum]|nr:hypothetical protein HYQ46_008783 [Verticillium longisporum]
MSRPSWILQYETVATSAWRLLCANWNTSLHTMQATCLICGKVHSRLCPRHCSREAIDQIINDVVMEVERYSNLAPSLSLAAEIIKEAEVRRRAFLSG